MVKTLYYRNLLCYVCETLDITTDTCYTVPAPHQSKGFLNNEQASELSHKGVNLLGQLWVIHLSGQGMGQSS